MRGEGWTWFAKFLPGAVISILLGWILLRAVDIPQTLAAFRSADLRFLGAAFLLNIFWLLTRGLVWRALLQKKASYRDTVITLGEGYLMNNFLPFRLGEFGRAFFISRKSELAFAEALSTILVERIFDLALSAALFVGVTPLLVHIAYGAQTAYLLGGAVILSLGALLFLARPEDAARRVFRAWSGKFPKLRSLSGLGKSLFRGLSVLTNRALFLEFLAWMLLDWAIAIVQYFLIIAAFFPQANLLWGAFVLSAAAFGGAIPSLPGALGTLEAAIGGALNLLSGNLSAALAAALAVRFYNYLFSSAVGIYGLTTEGETLSSVYRELMALKDREKEENAGGL